ncbi:DNA polymerase nu [Trichomycterus rosablanca]|uniref:DNA polymerase nu n=1 Tax=Trichomycterus rosablanca TaxID=2290929 RepID=UPI002F35BD88
MTPAPPLKRQSFGHFQIPVSTFSIQFEDENVGATNEVGKQNANERRDGIGVAAITKQREDQQLNVTMSEKVQLAVLSQGLAAKSSCDKGLICENGQIKDSQLLQRHNYLEERSTSIRNSPVPADPCCHHVTGRKLYFPNENHLPTNKIADNSTIVRSINHETKGCEDAPVDQGTVRTEQGESECTGVNDELCLPQSDERKIQITVKDTGTEQEHRTPSNPTLTLLSRPAQLQVSQINSAVESVAQTTHPTKQPVTWEPTKLSKETSKIPRSLETFTKQTASTPKLSSPSYSSSVNQGTKVQIFHQTQHNKATRQFLTPLKSAQAQGPTATKSKDKKHEPKVGVSLSDHDNAATEVKEQTHQKEDKGSSKSPEKTKLTLALTSDPRVCDASHLSEEERVCVLEEALKARALVVTMLYQDGTTQLDAEQKCPPPVCGILVQLKKSLDLVGVEEAGAAKERLLFLRLEQRPVWAQQDPQHNQDLFTRDVLLQMVCKTQTLVCYKAKDLLRTAVKHFSKDLTWKQVADCKVLDPQIAAWLLDPADCATCFQDLFNKYCTQPARHVRPQTALEHKKVTHVIASLSHLHRVMVELRNKLETQGLWKLYFCMEQKMIPILAAMESHKIHVDKEALKKTSEMLGVKMKQLEQEAHQAAGQQFLVSSSSQLRLVLFEKLRLHERCENKKLPKTLKQQQSTSEAALLQLQALHPLPKIILEYRQVHKIKSTFVDGILSCLTRTFISSTWNQTSTVSGRLSAKHPNFQALPRQSVQISRKQNVQGKGVELVTVHPRTMFIPQEGWTFLSADFCQVELRLLAHLSSDPELTRVFQNPEADVFTMLASQWKGVGEDSVSSEDREHAKRIVYSLVYGAGKERLSGILGVSAEEASHFQDTFLQTYREVQTFIQRTVQHCHRHGYVKSIMGRRRFLPHVHSTDWGVRTQAERQAVNFVVQGSAADICKMAMIQICSHVDSSTTFTARLLAQIHDELLFEVEDSQVEDFAVLVKKTMESLQHIDCLGVSLSVPLKVSVSTGRSWGSMCEVKLPPSSC